MMSLYCSCLQILYLGIDDIVFLAHGIFCLYFYFGVIWIIGV